ncbi:hypothetical protein ACQKPE_07450 [Pseudomonas sp. NPDC089554]|uniref:hypothetical protein n=1 Tax=Pseudomonas sp. NPDC089554 TaxID=3390653 RepID=UPI003D03E178
MYQDLEVTFFGHPISHPDVKQLLLNCHLNDFFWGTGFLPPYFFEYTDNGKQGLWAIKGNCTGPKETISAMCPADIPGVKILLKVNNKRGHKLVEEPQLRYALMQMPLGTTFRRDNYILRVLKRDITVKSACFAELQVTVDYI